MRAITGKLLVCDSLARGDGDRRGVGTRTQRYSHQLYSAGSGLDMVGTPRSFASASWRRRTTAATPLFWPSERPDVALASGFQLQSRDEQAADVELSGMLVVLGPDAVQVTAPVYSFLFEWIFD